jgi:hypothetical protein
MHRELRAHREVANRFPKYQQLWADPFKPVSPVFHDLSACAPSAYVAQLLVEAGCHVMILCDIVVARTQADAITTVRTDLRRPAVLASASLLVQGRPLRPCLRYGGFGYTI